MSDSDSLPESLKYTTSSSDTSSSLILICVVSYVLYIFEAYNKASFLYLSRIVLHFTRDIYILLYNENFSSFDKDKIADDSMVGIWNFSFKNSSNSTRIVSTLESSHSSISSLSKVLTFLVDFGLLFFFVIFILCIIDYISKKFIFQFFL